MICGHPGKSRNTSSFLLAMALSFVSRVVFAQSEINPFGHAEAPPREAPGSSSIDMPVHSGLDGEMLQLERSNASGGSAQLALEQAINPEEYICGRGDVFELTFWGAQNFKVRVTTDSEGRAFVPKVGYIVISNKTLTQARTAFKNAVRRFYPGLNFDMSLQQPRTFSVHIVGFVDKPGIYPANPVERVSVLLDRAGLTGRGSRRRVEIKRHDGTLVLADLWRYDTTGDTNLNPYVMDGDTISVPFADVVVGVAGATKRTGKFELISTKDLSELWELVGGFSSDVTHSLPVRIVQRGAGEQQEQRTLPFKSDGSVANVPLRDGDAVYVPTAGELQRSILIIGPVPGASAVDEATTTKRVSYVAGATVRSMLEGSGPIGASADLKNAYVRTDDGKLVPIDLDALLVKRDFSKDRTVQVGDTIVIPQRKLAVAIEGAIVKPGLYPYNLRFRSDQYIAVAGGPSRLAQARNTYRLVSPAGVVRPIDKNGTVEPGDTMVLPERAFSRSEIVQLIMGGVGLALTAVSVVILTVRQ